VGQWSYDAPSLHTQGAQADQNHYWICQSLEG
jgi:hypothetical protein